MPLDKNNKPILYVPWKNTSNSKNKMWVYVKADTKKGFRKSYLARAKGIKNKQGELTYKNKNSANYWSVRVLWNGP